MNWGSPAGLNTGSLPKRRQSRITRDRVRAAGVPCEAIVYPDEGHEISGLEHRVDYERRTVEFILEHIGRA